MNILLESSNWKKFTRLIFRCTERLFTFDYICYLAEPRNLYTEAWLIPTSFFKRMIWSNKDILQFFTTPNMRRKCDMNALWSTFEISDIADRLTV